MRARPFEDAAGTFERVGHDRVQLGEKNAIRQGETEPFDAGSPRQPKVLSRDLGQHARAMLDRAGQRPRLSKVVERGTAPSRGTRRCVGLMPTTPRRASTRIRPIRIKSCQQLTIGGREPYYVGVAALLWPRELAMSALKEGGRGLPASRAALKQILLERRALLAPGAANALTARVIEDLGFEVVYVTGAGVANTYLGVPDIGLLTVTELVDTVVRISDASALPMIVDIDTGFGNALNVGRVVHTLERAGAAALQIEDQVFPKKCGHFEGKSVIPVEEMVSKVKAAVDSRHDQDLQIIARTDARAIEGLDRAIERVERYREAGADVVFVEAPLDLEELRRVGSLPMPQVANIVVGGKTPEVSQAELQRLGFSLVLYANAALQASLKAIQIVLGRLKAQGSLSGAEDMLASFVERQRIVSKPAFDLLEERYRIPQGTATTL